MSILWEAQSHKAKNKDRFTQYLATEIGNGFEINLVHLGREPKTAKTLVVMIHQWTAANDSQGFGVAAKTILKQISKLALAEGNILVPNLYLFNNIREHTQRSIDMFGFV